MNWNDTLRHLKFIRNLSHDKNDTRPLAKLFFVYEPKYHLKYLSFSTVRDLQLLYDCVTFQAFSTLLCLTTMRTILACVACDLNSI